MHSRLVSICVLLAVMVVVSISVPVHFENVLCMSRQTAQAQVKNRDKKYVCLDARDHIQYIRLHRDFAYTQAISMLTLACDVSASVSVFVCAVRAYDTIQSRSVCAFDIIASEREHTHNLPHWDWNRFSYVCL